MCYAVEDAACLVCCFLQQCMSVLCDFLRLLSFTASVKALSPFTTSPLSLQPSHKRKSDSMTCCCCRMHLMCSAKVKPPLLSDPIQQYLRNLPVLGSVTSSVLLLLGKMRQIPLCLLHWLASSTGGSLLEGLVLGIPGGHCCKTSYPLPCSRCVPTRACGVGANITAAGRQKEFVA
jgi:hypothetical protein